MPETILVVGATGMLGEPVARRLAADGHSVRVMSRNLERVQNMFVGEKFETVEGDVEDAQSIEKAMNGCTGVHISLKGGSGDWNLESRGSKLISQVAAKSAGMKRITIITGASTCEENSWFPMTKAKVEAEKAVKDSGVPFTIFRCTMFNELMPALIRGNKALIIGEQPSKWHWIAANDYAEIVSKAFSTPEAENKTFYCYGPEALTFEEAMDIYLKTCHPEASILKLPFWLAGIMSWMPGKTKLRKEGLPIFRYFASVNEIGDSREADVLLGAPTTTVKQWSELQKGKK